ncbi:hypothetical protein PLUTE_a4208 [Pseudoalteromonas luteoviolacea DSM 6061]|nr:hypothetical protein [Pseudoalteromonas luteoviolacea DSM 6061]
MLHVRLNEFYQSMLGKRHAQKTEITDENMRCLSKTIFMA